MSDEQEIELWERREAEPMRWYARFLLYRDMGPGRSLLGAVKAEEAKKSKEKHSNSPPGAWSEACKAWEWRERAEAWDEEQQRLIIASAPYALMSERVKALDHQAHEMEKPYISALGSKEYYLRNSPDHMREWRGLLDDIAKEMGGRVKATKQEVTGKDGGPIEFVTEWGGGALADGEETEA